MSSRDRVLKVHEDAKCVSANTLVGQGPSRSVYQIFRLNGDLAISSSFDTEAEAWDDAASSPAGETPPNNTNWAAVYSGSDKAADASLETSRLACKKCDGLQEDCTCPEPEPVPTGGAAEVEAKFDPAFMVLVPRSPTPKMLTVALLTAMKGDVDGVWPAMIEAWDAQNQEAIDLHERLHPSAPEAAAAGGIAAVCRCATEVVCPVHSVSILGSLLAAPIAPAAALLHSASEPPPKGCHCKPGKCMAPVIMGKQMSCRDPEKAAGNIAPAAVSDAEKMTLAEAMVLRTKDEAVGCYLGELMDHFGDTTDRMPPKEDVQFQEDLLSRLYDEAVRIVSSQTASAEGDGWIAVTPETMPRTGAECLVVYDGVVQRIAYQRMGLGFACADGYVWQPADEIVCDPIHDRDVTHWRPLPAPPVNEETK